MAKFALILLVAFYPTSNLYAGEPVMHLKQLPTKMFDCPDIGLTEIFIDANNNKFIRVTVTNPNPHGTHFLYLNNGWVPLKQYGGLWNAFVKDGYLQLACKKDENIVIYKVHKDIELVSRIGIEGSLGKDLTGKHIERVIPVLGMGNAYYLLACRWSFPINPVEFLKNVISAGHGVYYWKPFLVEVRDKKLAKPQKLRYSGKIDESYYIRQVVSHGDLVHFLGFRTQEEPAWGPSKKESKPVMLHHAAYDLKKKKVIQSHTIYTDTPRADKDSQFFYEPLSIDALGNDVFVVFSWIPEELQPRPIPIPIKDIKSTIFYWQYSNGIVDDVKRIADGFCPLVKVDSFGNVHVLWVNKNASLIHKAKQNGKWGEDTVLVKNLDVDHGITAGGRISAEFDKENNLHIVYPSGGNLVHAKVKLN